MSKKSSNPVSPDTSWLAKRESASRQSQEDEKDEAYNKRQQIFARIKQAGLKPKIIFKAKLEDDLRMFEYVVQKVSKESGEVFLKNERGTVRKLSVFDKLFGPGAQTRNR
ncbi:MAG: hypothetical protein G01um101413_716 [Parcubacteria group bacterium Gr01-1014_13]|nr:MAG: hypothetical protein G01um101413_716 [Parcubacteria group bacterium Gr01-1014_13]